MGEQLKNRSRLLDKILQREDHFPGCVDVAGADERIPGIGEDHHPLSGSQNGARYDMTTFGMRTHHVVTKLGDPPRPLRRHR